MRAATLSPAALQLRADSDVVQFSFSDRPVQHALGRWREQRRCPVRFDAYDIHLIQACHATRH